MRLESYVPITRRARASCAQALIALLVLLASSSHAFAQAAGDARRAFASRAALESQAADAERASAEATEPAIREMHRGEAWLLRRRLTEGDFIVGDRIVLSVRNEPTLTDTFTVRSGLVLEFEKFPPISLHAVLRSELESHVTTQLGRYIREPDVTALPLVRIAVMGQVGRPGYYHVPADMLLTDLLMSAGGPNANADLGRSEIRRGEGELFKKNDVRIALADGMSLDALSLKSGDEFHLGEKRNLSWTSVLRIVTVTSGIVSLVLSLTN